MSFLRKLNLQYFAEDAGTTGASQLTEGGDQPSNPPGGGEPKQPQAQAEPPKAEPAKPATPPVDTKAIAKQAQDELLKQLGVSDLKSAKDILKAYKDYQDSQKTEAEKQAEKLAEYEKKLQEKDAAIAKTNAKVSALSKGVKPDAVDDVIKLVSGSEDVGKALDDVLAKYPQFKQEAAAQADSGDDKSSKKPAFGNADYNGGKKPSQFDTWIDAFKKQTLNVTK